MPHQSFNKVMLCYARVGSCLGGEVEQDLAHLLRREDTLRTRARRHQHSEEPPSELADVSEGLAREVLQGQRQHSRLRNGPHSSFWRISCCALLRRPALQNGSPACHGALADLVLRRRHQGDQSLQELRPLEEERQALGVRAGVRPGVERAEALRGVAALQHARERLREGRLPARQQRVQALGAPEQHVAEQPGDAEPHGAVAHGVHELARQLGGQALLAQEDLACWEGPQGVHELDRVHLQQNVVGQEAAQHLLVGPALLQGLERLLGLAPQLHEEVEEPDALHVPQALQAALQLAGQPRVVPARAQDGQGPRRALHRALQHGGRRLGDAGLGVQQQRRADCQEPGARQAPHALVAAARELRQQPDHEAPDPGVPRGRPLLQEGQDLVPEEPGPDLVEVREALEGAQQGLHVLGPRVGQGLTERWEREAVEEQPRGLHNLRSARKLLSSLSCGGHQGRGILAKLTLGSPS
mmetsp:Transcript_93576/g.274059  ORF Transcript_93576/g.274059 Transcript_93576/m.274059 type:complete len:471 (+) Transcript_93576:234-1646(+)